MHRIEGDESLLEAELAQQGLNRRDFVGLLLTIEMRQDEGSVGREGAQNMCGFAVLEMVEALPQRFAIDGDVTLPILIGVLLEDSGVAAEHPLDRCRVQLLEDASDGRVGWRAPPFQPEKLAQAMEMDIDETVDRPV